MQQHSDYRPDIDGMRAIAVLAVLAFHGGFSAVSGGFVGVDVFFVISGFLISAIIKREVDAGRFSIIGFYERRFRRIFPALAVVSAATFVAALFILVPTDFRQFSQSLVAVALFASNILFWKESDYFAHEADEKPLLHTWSLAVEEQYYMVFPLLAIVIGWLALRHRNPVILALIALSFAVAVVQVRIAPTAAFYLPFSRFWELLAGAALTYGIVRPPASPMAKNAAGVAGLAMVLYSIFLFDRNTPFPGEAALLPCIGTCLLILARDSDVTRVLTLRPIVFVGLVSYSLYLWHWPLIVLTRYYVGYTQMRALTDLEMGLILLASFVLAVLSWRFVERPFRVKPVLFNRPQLFAAVAGSMVLMVAAGSAGHLTQGLPFRLPEAARELAAAELDINPLRKACDRRAPEKIEAGDVCRIGAEGDATPSFALIGDSFADALAPGIAAAAETAGQTGLLVTRSGCYALVAVDQGTACGRFVQAAVDLVNKTAGIETVVLVNRWTSIALGTRFGSFERADLLLTDAESKGASIAENAKVFDRALRRTIAAFPGKRVVVVAHVPEQRFDAPRVLAMRSWRREGDTVGLERAVHDERQALVRRTFAEVGAAEPFDVVDVGGRLCDEETCRIMEKGVVLYLDDNHLSRGGAIEVADAFAPIFGQTQRSSLLPLREKVRAKPADEGEPPALQELR